MRVLGNVTSYNESRACKTVNHGAVDFFNHNSRLAYCVPLPVPREKVV